MFHLNSSSSSLGPTILPTSDLTGLLPTQLVRSAVNLTVIFDHLTWLYSSRNAREQVGCPDVMN